MPPAVAVLSIVACLAAGALAWTLRTRRHSAAPKRRATRTGAVLAPLLAVARGAAATVRDSWWVTLAVALTGLAAAAVSSMVVAASAGASASAVEADPASTQALFQLAASIVLPAAVVLAVVGAATAAALVTTAHDAATGAAPGVRRSVRLGVSRTPSVVAASVLAGGGVLLAVVAAPALVVLGVLGLVLTPFVALLRRRWAVRWPSVATLVTAAVPFATAVRLGLRWSLVLPSAALEQVSPVGALRRSSQLVAGRSRLVAAAVLASLLLVGVPTVLAQALSGDLVRPSAASSIVQLLLFGVSLAVVAVLYATLASDDGRSRPVVDRGPAGGGRVSVTLVLALVLGMGAQLAGLGASPAAAAEAAAAAGPTTGVRGWITGSNAWNTKGVAGAQVRLIGDTSTRTLTTDAEGVYTFTSVPAGTYTIEVDAPEKWRYPAAPSGSTSRISDYTHDDFVDRPGTARATLTVLADASAVFSLALHPAARVTVSAFDDANGNGVRDLGEDGVAGATLQVLDAAGDPIAGVAQTTTPHHLHEFHLRPDTYAVEVVPPTGYELSEQGQGSDPYNDSDFDPTTGRSAQFAVASGGVERLGAALFNPAPPDRPDWNTGWGAPGAAVGIGGLVFDDVDADGIADPFEEGVQGVTVEVLDAGDVVLGSLVSGGVGDDRRPTPGIWWFSEESAPGLEAALRGSGAVVRVVPGARTLSLSGQGDDRGLDSDFDPTTGRSALLTLPDGENHLTLDAGVFTPATAGGTVFDDSDRDGVRAISAPGLADVEVTLVRRDTVTDDELERRSTTTNVFGRWTLPGLTPGLWTVTVGLPAGRLFTHRDVGADDALDSDVDVATGEAVIVLVAGGSVLVDAGMVTGASVTGTVWDDVDRDGVRAPGESGVGGVTVQLVSTLDPTTPLAQTTTATDGTYAFIGLGAGNYQVQVAGQIGWVFSPALQGDPTTDSDVAADGLTPAFDLAAGALAAAVDAGTYRLRPASLSGRVFEDVDADGSESTGDLARDDVVVRLYEDPDADDVFALRSSTRSAADGSWTFAALPTGRYRVESDVPVDWAATTPNPSATQVLTPEQDLVGLALGATRLPPASLSGTVWDDGDGDGVRQPGEPGLADVPVTLYLASSPTAALADSVTAADGSWAFAGLGSGSYLVQVGLLAGRSFSPSGAGTDRALDSDVDPDTGRSGLLTLATSEVRTGVDAGTVPPVVPPPAPATLTGSVFEDLDGDGSADGSEPALADRAVSLYADPEQDGTFAFVRGARTEPDGTFRFTGLQAGRYRVLGAADPVWRYTTPNPTAARTLSAGETGRAADLGVQRLAAGALAGVVWDDTDRDAVRSPGEPALSGVTVQLLLASDTTTPVAVTTTDATGYRFDGLLPGSYVVSVQLPTGYAFGAQGAGQDRSLDSDVDPATGRTSAVTLGEGTEVTGLDAAVATTRAAVLAGRVFDDLDDDGVLGSGEPARSGWVVSLFAERDGRDELVSRTLSGADGGYRFDQLPTGTYTVRLEDRADHRTSGPAGGTTLTLTDGQQALEVDLGVWRLPRLHIVLFEDVDGDGVRDVGTDGAPVQPVDVSVEQPDGTVLARRTSAAGRIELSGLEPGEVVVRTAAGPYTVTTPDPATVSLAPSSRPQLLLGISPAPCHRILPTAVGDGTLAVAGTDGGFACVGPNGPGFTTGTQVRLRADGPDGMYVRQWTVSDPAGRRTIPGGADQSAPGFLEEQTLPVGDGDLRVLASLRRCSTLALAVSGPGAVQVAETPDCPSDPPLAGWPDADGSGSGTARYRDDAPVTLTTDVAGPQILLDTWGDDAPTDDPTRTLRLDGDTDLAPRFWDRSLCRVSVSVLAPDARWVVTPDGTRATTSGLDDPDCPQRDVVPWDPTTDARAATTSTTVGLQLATVATPIAGWVWSLTCDHADGTACPTRAQGTVLGTEFEHDVLATLPDLVAADQYADLVVQPVFCRMVDAFVEVSDRDTDYEVLSPVVLDGDPSSAFHPWLHATTAPDCPLGLGQYGIDAWQLTTDPGFASDDIAYYDAEGITFNRGGSASFQTVTARFSFACHTLVNPYAPTYIGDTDTVDLVESVGRDTMTVTPSLRPNCPGRDPTQHAYLEGTTVFLQVEDHPDLVFRNWVEHDWEIGPVVRGYGGIPDERDVVSLGVELEGRRSTDNFVVMAGGDAREPQLGSDRTVEINFYEPDFADDFAVAVKETVGVLAAAMPFVLAVVGVLFPIAGLIMTAVIVGTLAVGAIADSIGNEIDPTWGNNISSAFSLVTGNGAKCAAAWGLSDVTEPREDALLLTEATDRAVAQGAITATSLSLTIAGKTAGAETVVSQLPASLRAGPLSQTRRAANVTRASKAFGVAAAGVEVGFNLADIEAEYGFGTEKTAEAAWTDGRVFEDCMADGDRNSMWAP